MRNSRSDPQERIPFGWCYRCRRRRSTLSWPWTSAGDSLLVAGKSLWVAGKTNAIPSIAAWIPDRTGSIRSHPLWRLFAERMDPDLAPADFFLFPRPKSIMKGARFVEMAAIQERVTAVLRSIPTGAFADSFQKLYERYQKCVVKNDDYFEDQ